MREILKFLGFRPPEARTPSPFLVRLSQAVEKAEAIRSRREKTKTLNEIIKEIKEELPVNPAIAYACHALLGRCFSALGSYVQTIKHFGMAVELHPAKNEESDFRDYVAAYMRANNNLNKVPKDQRPALAQLATTKFPRLFSALPSWESGLALHTGVSYLVLERPQEALPYFERAVLSHPDPTLDEFRDCYIPNYRACYTRVFHEANSKLHRPEEREQALEDLKSVLQTTGRVAVKYPKHRATKVIAEENRGIARILAKEGVPLEAYETHTQISLN